MKLITHFELATLSREELHALQRKVSSKAAILPRGSTERQNAHASLQNIRRELAMRSPGL